MSQDVHEAYLRARQCFQQGEYGEAERLLQDVVRARPRYADVHNLLGLLYFQRGALEQAAASFRRALDVNPAYTEASLNLAVTLNELGRYEQADRVVVQAAKAVGTGSQDLDPYVRGKLANEHARLGDLYHHLGCFREATEEYRKALRLRGELADVLTRLAVTLREMGDHEGAVAELTRALKANPGYIPARIQLGLTYYSKGYTGMAVREWEAALQADPASQEARRYLSVIKHEPFVPRSQDGTGT